MTTKEDTKRARYRRAFDETIKRAVVTELRQRCPWTYVAIKIETEDGKLFQGLTGFSKVCWPDKWDSNKGIQLAKERAVAWHIRENRAMYGL